jgi:hypothetical protein
MPFVRKKTDHAGRQRFYLVENSRIDGRVKQKVLAYLGGSATPENALWIAAGDLWGALRRRKRLDAKRPDGARTKSDRLDLERVGRKIARLIERIEQLKAYAEAPVCLPGLERLDDQIQRFWRSLKIVRDATDATIWHLEYRP